MQTTSSELRDHYTTLGVPQTATHDEIRHAYRRLARKYHPDVSKEPDAQTRFMAAAEAHEALIDTDRRAAYDDLRHQQTAAAQAARNRQQHAASASEADDVDGLFETLFNRQYRGEQGRPHPGFRPSTTTGMDHQSPIEIDLADIYKGAKRTLSLQTPVVDAMGRASLQTRQLEVDIPKGVRPGQRLRLAGQGGAGYAGGAAGDLYLDIVLKPHPQFQVEDLDVYVNLSVAPWEAALGATLDLPTPEGPVQLTIPPESFQGRKLRLRGRGLPGQPPGDLYARLCLVLPPATSEADKKTYSDWASAFPHFNPRA